MAGVLLHLHSLTCATAILVRYLVQALFGPRSQLMAENYGVNGQCVHYGSNSLLENITQAPLRSRIPHAKAVVLWIGKNHIRGDFRSKRGRSSVRAAAHAKEDVRQVLTALVAAKLPAGCTVLLLGLFVSAPMLDLLP